MPIDYIQQISKITFTLTFNAAHPGQNFESVSKASLQLDFKKVKSRAGYVEILETAFFFVLLTEDIIFPRSYAVGPLLPASFTLRTSRTSPDDPQPVMA